MQLIISEVCILEKVRIPQDRIAVLIGASGEAKKAIQEKAGIRLRVDVKRLIVDGNCCHCVDPMNIYMSYPMVPVSIEI